MKKKEEIRKECLKIRRNLTREEISNKSLKIQEKFLKSEYYKKNIIMCYASLATEVETFSLIERIIKDKNLVIMPKCVPNERKILPCQIRNIKELFVGLFGILEPKEVNIINKEAIELVITPSVACDKNGARIGHGFGYYDRFLSDYEGEIIAFCFKECLQTKISEDEHDVKIKKVFTD